MCKKPGAGEERKSERGKRDREGAWGRWGRQAGSRQRAPVGGGGGVAQFKVSRIYDKENFEMHLVMDLWDKDLKRGLR